MKYYVSLQKIFAMLGFMKKYSTRFGLINAFSLVNSPFLLERDSHIIIPRARTLKTRLFQIIFCLFSTESNVFLTSKKTLEGMSVASLATDLSLIKSLRIAPQLCLGSRVYSLNYLT